MKAIKSSDLTDILEERVERSIHKTIASYQNLSEDVLLRPSSSGGWSIAQCLEHLNSYGHYYLPQIKSALEKNKEIEAKEYYKSGWLGAYFTKMMEPAAKTKFKAFKDHIPPQDLNPHVVVAEFIEQQETLMKYLKQARTTDMSAVKIPISIARFIKLKLGDVFQFLIAHSERHLMQADRNLM